MRSATFMQQQPRIPERSIAASRAAFLVALDSEGTVLDTMLARHEGCFAPAFIACFGEGVDPEAMASVWRFVNIESRFRGSNRFRSLSLALRALPGHPRIGRARESWARTAAVLDKWLYAEPAPTHRSLSSIAKPGSPLAPVLAWSDAVDAAIADLPPPRPFPGAAAALSLMAGESEILVLASVPKTVLRAEWKAAGILGRADFMRGSERGSKVTALAAHATGRFPAGKVLVIGDSLCDLELARSHGASFFPVVPGREEHCWDFFVNEGFERFLSRESSPGRGLLADFLGALPSEPPWSRA